MHTFLIKYKYIHKIDKIILLLIILFVDITKMSNTKKTKDSSLDVIIQKINNKKTNLNDSKYSKLLENIKAWIDIELNNIRYSEIVADYQSMLNDANIDDKDICDILINMNVVNVKENIADHHINNTYNFELDLDKYKIYLRKIYNGDSSGSYTNESLKITLESNDLEVINSTIYYDTINVTDYINKKNKNNFNFICKHINLHEKQTAIFYEVLIKNFFSKVRYWLPMNNIPWID